MSTKVRRGAPPNRRSYIDPALVKLRAESFYVSSAPVADETLEARARQIMARLARVTVATPELARQAVIFDRVLRTETDPEIVAEACELAEDLLDRLEAFAREVAQINRCDAPPAPITPAPPFWSVTRSHVSQDIGRQERHCTTRRSSSRSSSTTRDDGDSPGDPPSPQEIEDGLLLLLYFTGARAQQRAFTAALVELEDRLEGDRLDDEQVETFVEVRYGEWPSDYREEFGDWLGAEHPGLFERPVNGRSRLVEPVEYGPWLEPADDDPDRPF